MEHIEFIIIVDIPNIICEFDGNTDESDISELYSNASVLRESLRELEIFTKLGAKIWLLHQLSTDNPDTQAELQTSVLGLLANCDFEYEGVLTRANIRFDMYVSFNAANPLYVPMQSSIPPISLN